MHNLEKTLQTFYKTLYTSHENTIPPDNDFFQLENDNFLDYNDSACCEGLLTEKECLEALKDMASEKTPGTNGLPAEFYKTFWDVLSPILITAFNYTQRRRIIKLMPKKDADPHFIKKWRPLIFLNCDYQIVLKAIANRIKKSDSKIINNEQTGFLKDIFFFWENIRLIDSIINYAPQQHIPGLLLFIDFENRVVICQSHAAELIK